jgi:SAM-dependent methyltransferase
VCVGSDGESVSKARLSSQLRFLVRCKDSQLDKLTSLNTLKLHVTTSNATTNPPLKHSLKRLLLHVRRRLYGVRSIIPGLRERHRLEKMVGPLGFWTALQRYHLELLTRNGLKHNHRLLDVGCGPLLGGIKFIEYLDPNNYVGYDIDPVRIETAKEQIKKHKLETKKPRIFVSSDFGASELRETFDFIWASQMLYYFDDEKLKGIFRTVATQLAPGGKFLGDVFELDHYEFRFPELGKYVRHTPESMQKVAAHAGLNCTLLGTIGEFGYPKRLSLRKNLLFELTHR